MNRKSSDLLVLKWESWKQDKYFTCACEYCVCCLTDNRSKTNYWYGIHFILFLNTLQISQPNLQI